MEHQHSFPQYEEAKALFIKEQAVSVSLLQRRLKLGYSHALSLMDKLEMNGVVTQFNAAHFRTLTPQYMTPLRQPVPVDALEKYTRQVFETALFFWEMYEEGQGGDTRAIKLLYPFVSSVEVRNYVLGELYSVRHLSLIEAALQLAVWKPETIFSQVDLNRIQSELHMLCAEYKPERQSRPVTDKDEILRRSSLRMARYLRRILTERASNHSRVVEFFIPNEFVPRGYGKNEHEHIEHVVPCALLRDRSLSLLQTGWSTNEVAHYVLHFLTVVEISKKERDRLDKSRAQGGLGLKTKMPPNWNFDDGCIYDRLHDAKISFDPPAGIVSCAC